jgi:hypothetical protein
MATTYNPFDMASAPLLELEMPLLYDTFPTPPLFDTFPSQGYTPLEPFNPQSYPPFPSNYDNLLYQPTYQPSYQPIEQVTLANNPTYSQPPPAYSSQAPIVSEYFYPDVVVVIEQPGYSRDSSSTNDEVIEIIEEKVVDVRPIAFGESWKKPEEEKLQTGDVRGIISAFEKRLKKVEEDVPRRQIIRRRRRRLIKPGQKLDNGKYQPAQYEYYFEEFEADDKYVFKEGDVVVEEAPQEPSEPAQPVEEEEEEKKKGFFDRVLDKGKDIAKDKAKSIVEDILKDLAKKAYKEVEPTFWNKFDEYTDGQFASLHAPTLRNCEPRETSFSLPSLETELPSLGELPSVGLSTSLPTFSLPSVGTLSSLPALSNLSLLSGPLSSVASAAASGAVGLIGSAPGLLTALVASAPAVLNAVSPQGIATGVAYGAVSAAAHAAPGLISGVGSSLLSLSATGLETGIGMISTIGSALPSLSSLRPNFGKPSMKKNLSMEQKPAPKTKSTGKRIASKSISAIEDRIETELEQILQDKPKQKVKSSKRDTPVTRKVTREQTPKIQQQAQPLKVRAQDVQKAQHIQQERMQQLSDLGKLALRGRDPEGYTFSQPETTIKPLQSTTSISNYQSPKQPLKQTEKQVPKSGVKSLRKDPEGYTFTTEALTQQLLVQESTNVAPMENLSAKIVKPAFEKSADTKPKKKKAKKPKKEKAKKGKLIDAGKIVDDVMEEIDLREPKDQQSQPPVDTETHNYSEQPATFASSQFNGDTQPSVELPAYTLPVVSQPDLKLDPNYRSRTDYGYTKQIARQVPDITSGSVASNELPSNAGIASMMKEPVVDASLFQNQQVAPSTQTFDSSVSLNNQGVTLPNTTRVTDTSNPIIQSNSVMTTHPNSEVQDTDETKSLGLIDAGRKLMKDVFGKTKSNEVVQPSSNVVSDGGSVVTQSVVDEPQLITIVNEPIQRMDTKQPAMATNTVSQSVAPTEVKTHVTQHSVPTLPSISINELVNEPNIDQGVSVTQPLPNTTLSNTQASTQPTNIPSEATVQYISGHEEQKTSHGIIDAGRKFVQDIFGNHKSTYTLADSNNKETTTVAPSLDSSSTVQEVKQVIPITTQSETIEIQSTDSSLLDTVHVVKSVPVSKFVHQSSQEVPTKSVLVDEVVAPSTHSVSTDECEIRDTNSPSSAVTTSQYSFAPSTSTLSNFVSRPIMTESTQPFATQNTTRPLETSTSEIILNESAPQPGHQSSNSGISNFFGSIKRAFTRDTRTEEKSSQRQPSDITPAAVSPVVKDVNKPVEQPIKNPIELIAPTVEHQIEVREQQPMIQVQSQQQPQVIVTKAEPTVSQKAPTTETITVEAPVDSHTPSEVIIEGAHQVTSRTVMHPTFGWQPTVSASEQPVYTIQPRENLPHTDSTKRRGMTNSLQSDLKVLQNTLPAPSPYSPVPINDSISVQPESKVIRVMSPGAVAPHDIVTSTMITQETKTTTVAPKVVSTKRTRWDNFLLVMNSLSTLAWFAGATVNIVGSSLFLGGDQFATAAGILYIIGFSLWAAAATIAFIPPLLHPFSRSSWVGADINFRLKSYDIVNCFATAGIMASMTLFIIGAALWLSSTAGLNQSTVGIWVAAGSLWVLSTFVRDFALRRESGDIRSKLSIFMRGIAADMMLVASVLFLLGAILFMVRYNNFSINTVTAQSFGVGAGILWIVGGATVATSSVTQAIAQR